MKIPEKKITGTMILNNHPFPDNPVPWVKIVTEGYSKEERS